MVLHLFIKQWIQKYLSCQFYSLFHLIVKNIGYRSPMKVMYKFIVWICDLDTNCVQSRGARKDEKGPEEDQFTPLPLSNYYKMAAFHFAPIFGSHALSSFVWSLRLSRARLPFWMLTDIFRRYNQFRMFIIWNLIFWNCNWCVIWLSSASVNWRFCWSTSSTCENNININTQNTTPRNYSNLMEQQQNNKTQPTETTWTSRKPTTGRQRTAHHNRLTQQT